MFFIDLKKDVLISYRVCIFLPIYNIFMVNRIDWFFFHLTGGYLRECINKFWNWIRPINKTWDEIFEVTLCLSTFFVVYEIYWSHLILNWIGPIERILLIKTDEFTNVIFEVCSSFFNDFLDWQWFMETERLLIPFLLGNYILTWWLFKKYWKLYSL